MVSLEKHLENQRNLIIQTLLKQVWNSLNNKLYSLHLFLFDSKISSEYIFLRILSNFGLDTTGR